MDSVVLMKRVKVLKDIFGLVVLWWNFLYRLIVIVILRLKGNVMLVNLIVVVIF